MRTSIRLMAAIAALAVALTAAVGTADAAKPTLGIADQKPDTFTNPFYTGLKIKRTRIVVPWDAGLRADANLDQLLGRIRAAKLEPLVHFGKNCAGRNCELPSVKRYVKAFRAFHKRYGFVKVFGVWNEENHGDQPTHTNKGAKRAAEYYNAVRKECGKCTFVAADVLDTGNLKGWFKTFRKTAKNPKVIGLHNYRDVNTSSTKGTRQLFALLKNARGKVTSDVWMTETGGLYFFQTGKGKVQYKESEARQRKAIKFTLALPGMKEFQGRIKRVYLYHWRSDGSPAQGVRFDAGLLRADGTPRKAFAVVKSSLKSGTFKR